MQRSLSVVQTGVQNDNLYVLRQLLVHPKDPIPPCRGQELCTIYLVHHAQRCTLARLTVPWNNASRNTKGHWLQAPPSLQLLNMRWTPTMTLIGQMHWLLTVPAPWFKMCLGSKLGISNHRNTPWTDSKDSYLKPITPSYTLHHFPVLVILISPHFLFSTRINCQFEHLSVPLMMISV